jgi:hypothetical protein
VEDYVLGQYVSNGGTNTILKNVNYTASSKNFGAAHVKVKGGGEIYYISNPSKEKIDGLSKQMVHDACDAKKEHYKARYSFGQDLLPMKKKMWLFWLLGIIKSGHLTYQHTSTFFNA